MADRTDPTPRLCPHLPLPAAPHRPGRGDRRPELPALPPDPAPDSEAVRFGFDLLDGGFPWEAHEVWEGPWHVARRSDPETAALLQALIQIAAARVLARDGRAAGAARVAARAAVHLERGRGALTRFGLEPEAVESAVAAAADPRARPVRLSPRPGA